MQQPSANASGDELSPGSMLGKYRLSARLGEGAMGVVYSAVHEKLGRPVAIKVLKPDLSASTELSSRFQMEAELVTRIGHPNIVAVYDFGRLQSGSLYYVMEMIRGQSLRSRLDKKPLSPQEIVQVIGPLLSAVRAAHEIGVVHRDLKPDNVMLLTGAEGGVGAVKLLDFGIAKFRGGQVLGEPTINGLERTELPEGGAGPAVGGSGLATSAGSVMGTPAYMAPEQVKNSSAVDKRADIYAIGIMLYEVLTGRRPFEAESSAELMGAHMYMQAEPPSKVVAKNNVADRPLNWQKLDPVVMKALAKKPEERYQDCSALQTDLEAAWGQSFSIARGATLQAPAVSVPQAAPAIPQKSGRGKLFLAVGLAVVLLGGGVSVALLGGAGRTASAAQLERSEQILQAASKGSPADRRALLEAIHTVGGRNHLPLVVQALADEDPTVARAALQAVRTIGKPGDSQLAEPLATLAGNAVGAASVEIAAAQLQIGEQEAQGVLSAMLRSPIPTPEVRLQAAVVLASAGQLPAPALRQFLEAAIKSGMKQPALRRDALVRLAVAKDPEALRQLETLAAGGSDDKALHLEALQVLTLAKHPGTADKLRHEAKKLPHAEQIELLETLAEAQDSHAVSLLLPLLHDPQPKVKKRALAALGSLAQKKLWHHPDKTLIPLLEDADAQVAQLAAVTLLAESAATEERKDVPQK